MMESEKIVNYELALTENINNTLCSFYNRPGIDGVMTREQIGTILGYADPQRAIGKIHASHRERMDKLSTTEKVIAPDGKLRETVVYQIEGWFEICRWSRQPTANMVMDALYAVMKKLFTAGTVSVNDLPELLGATLQDNPQFAFTGVIPALQSSNIDQREFVGDLLGMTGGDAYSGAEINKRLDANARGEKVLRVWKKRGAKIFTTSDLPEKYHEHFATKSILRKLAANPRYAEGFAEYCGVMYMSGLGLRAAVDYFIRNKGISHEDGTALLNEKIGHYFY